MAKKLKDKSAIDKAADDAFADLFSLVQQHEAVGNDVLKRQQPKDIFGRSVDSPYLEKPKSEPQGFGEQTQVMINRLENLKNDIKQEKQMTNNNVFSEVQFEKPENPNDFSAILRKAKQNSTAAKQSSWKDPAVEAEKQKTQELKAMGKSAYDSDVLRERILRRQAAKRAGLMSEIQNIDDDDPWNNLD